MNRGNATQRWFPGMERPCRECGKALIVTEQMLKHSKYVCGQCQSRRAIEYARNNRDKKRAANNAYAARNSASRASATRTYRTRHPDRRLAHQAVQTALRNGTLTRSACEVCGAVRSHAHHDDYARPLDVVWLCHRHHMEHHSMIAARSAKEPTP